jgi:nitrate reductase gamma subunit
MKLPGMILIVIAYTAYSAFLIRFVLHLLLWLRASGQMRMHIPAGISPARPETYAGMLIDILFFRRLFIENKWLWVGSWTFHVSLFLVILRHGKYILDPVPGFIRYIQPLGTVAGYLLPLSLILILILRTTSRRDTYVSYYNYFLLSTVLGISITGLVIRGDSQQYIIHRTLPLGASFTAFYTYALFYCTIGYH